MAKGVDAVPLEHSSPARAGRAEDAGVVGFVRDVKAALLAAAVDAAERGLAITSARLQVTSTLTSGPTGGIGASAGIGGLFLDVAQLSFHRKRSDSHQLDMTFRPAAPRSATAGPSGTRGQAADPPRGGAPGVDTGRTDLAGTGGGGAAADAGAAGARAMADAARWGSRTPEHGSDPLAQQLAAVVGSVADVAAVLFADEPASTPTGGATGGAGSSASGGAAGSPAAPPGGLPGDPGGPEAPLATMTLNLAVDEGGAIQLVLGGRRDVETTHVLTLTFGRLQD